MNKCDSVDLYSSLDFCEGQTVLPGIRKKVYFQKKIHIRNVTLIPLVQRVVAQNALYFLMMEISIIPKTIMKVLFFFMEMVNK